MFFFWGGKCPNLGLVNIQILGVVNVLLANVFFGGWEMSEFGVGKCPNLGGDKCPPPIPPIQCLALDNSRLRQSLLLPIPTTNVSMAEGKFD